MESNENIRLHFERYFTANTTFCGSAQNYFNELCNKYYSLYFHTYVWRFFQMLIELLLIILTPKERVGGTKHYNLLLIPWKAGSNEWYQFEELYKVEMAESSDELDQKLVEDKGPFINPVPQEGPIDFQKTVFCCTDFEILNPKII